MSKWLLSTLLISLALNLALAGFLVGREAVQPRLAGGPPPMLHYHRWAAELSEERQAALRPLVRGHFATRRSSLVEMRQQHQALQELLRQNDLDVVGLQQTLAQLRTRFERAQAAEHEGFVDFVAALTPTERAALADRLARPKRRDRPRWRQPPRDAGATVNPRAHDKPPADARPRVPPAHEP